MNFTATARPIPGSLRTEIDVNGRHTMITDEPEELGGTDTASTPHELLPAAIAACVSTMMTMYADRHGWDLDGLEVHVDYDSDVTPRGVEVKIGLPSGLTLEQMDRLERVARTCPVRRALEAGFAFEERLAAASVVS